MSIPLPIETERLLLRRFTTDDVDAMLRVYGDPEAMRYIPNGAVDAATAARMLREYERAQDERGFSVWAVVLRDDHTVIGDAGFGAHPETGEPELGWTLAREHWGRGYATEAARACLDAVFAHLPVERVVALVDVDNEASRRVAVKIGMVPLQTIEAHGRPHILFASTRRAA